MPYVHYLFIKIRNGDVDVSAAVRTDPGRVTNYTVQVQVSELRNIISKKEDMWQLGVHNKVKQCFRPGCNDSLLIHYR